MTQSDSQRFILILARIKKRPRMYIEKACMSNLSAFYLGFLLGCDSNGESPEEEETEFDSFIDALCVKHSINSPWHDSLIKYCNSDEKAYELFMNEFELFLKDKEKYISNSL